VLLGRPWLSPAQFLAGLLLPALAVTKRFTEGLLARQPQIAGFFLASMMLLAFAIGQ
jgi:hypothetical protein